MSNPIEIESSNDDNQAKQQKKEPPKKKYDPIDYYLEDSFVDCKDSTGSWCLAHIIQRVDSDRTIKVNFDGWSHKWDEWLRFTSTRLAPFRKYSVGYTGQNRYAIRDFQFSVQEIKEKTENLQKIVSSDFGYLETPFDVTQYFRGSEYVYIDCLLQNEYKKPKEQLPFVFKHIKFYFQAYIKFLKMLPELIPEYLEGIANLDTFLTNRRVALAHCLPEMSETFNKIMGFSERLWGQFSSYDAEENEISICESDEYSGRDITTCWTADEKKKEDDILFKKKERKYSEMICQLVNLFGVLGGFEAWTTAFTFFKEEQIENSTALLLPPFKMMSTLLGNISNILVYLNKGLVTTLFPAIKTAVTRRLRYISDKEIKDLDREVLLGFLRRTQAVLIHQYPQDEIFLETETAELDLALRFLTCPYFEKRLRGINEIKELTEKIDLYEHFTRNPQHYSAIYSQKMTKKLSAKMFLEWVDKNKVLELILGDSIHLEIIKRTNDILKFLAKYESLPLNILDLIWNARTGKHEAIAMGIDNLIVDIADTLNVEGIEYLKKKIDSIPDEEQNEISLNLIKGFALKTLPPSTQSQMLEKEEEGIDENNFCCVNTLWRLMLDDSKVAPVLAENALFGLINVLKESQCPPLRRLYLQRCFEQMKKRDSVSQCINLIHSILNNSYTIDKYNPDISLLHILQQLDKEYNLIELSISEFEDFQKKMADIISKKSIEPTEEEKEKIYFGKYSYSTNFQNRLIFIEYLLTNPAHELIFRLPEIERMWDILALKPIWESDREYFFGWISRSHEAHTVGESTSVLTNKVIPEFFEKILCNHEKFDFINMSPKAFECFQTYFKVVNEIKDNFRATKGPRFIILDLNYDGKESLWSIFLHCKNLNTLNKVVNLLVKCCLRLGPNLEKEKTKVCEEFTYKCMNLLKEGYQNQNDGFISRAVLLLMYFFDTFEGKNRLDAAENNEKNRYSINMTATLMLKPDNAIKTIQVNSTQTIGQLRSQIAEAFGLTINEFRIYCKGSIIDNDEDDALLYNYPFGGPYVVQKIQHREEDANFHPKNIMTQNTEYIDLLFKLLSEDFQAVNSIWDLLIRVPVNETIKNSLYEINDSWENLLELKSYHVHRLLYCLQIIEDFLIDKETERMNVIDITHGKCSLPFKDETWMQRFYQSGGLKAFIEILLKPEMANIKSIISIKCLNIVVKISSYFFTKTTFQNLFGEAASHIETQVIDRLINIIYNTCEYSFIRERSETEASKNNQPFIKAALAGYQEPLQIPENLYYESELVSHAQAFLLISVKRNPSLLLNLYQYPKLDTMLSIGLIESGNVYLKEKLSHGLFNLLVNFEKVEGSPSPNEFLVPILLQNTLEKALTQQDHSEVFFRMLTSVVNNIDFGIVKMDVDNLLTQLVRFIRERKPKERSQKETDIVLHGILILLKGLFSRFPEKAQKYGQDERLVSELLQNCLFEIYSRHSRKEIPGPKCKSQYSRYAAFKLLLELAKGSNDNLREIINYISPIHRNGSWRTKRFVDWHIVSKDNEKSSTGYVGLKNLGCICYMNSTIQQLYMLPSFRKAVLEVEDKSGTAKEDNVLYQLKCIFSALNESEKQYFNPKDFCQAFKDYEGNPTNVYEQMDADEFFNTFMDRLENQIKGTRLEQFIKHHFGGVVSNELICKGCPHYSEREEPFLTVNLQVKNKKSIDQSLAAFVEGEMLEGDNAYHCAICDKKVNTLKRVCLKKLPNHLILVLKRFEFDFDTMTKVKVNDYCEFPMKLNVEPYTQQGLRKAEKAKKGEDQAQSNETSTDEYPSSYFEYKLTGVVIHIGFADSGHYYSLIQDNESNEGGDEKWYEFNDHMVSYFDPKDIPSEAFGGEEKWKYYHFSDNTSSYKEKIKNAYLLFYERIVHFDPKETEAPKKEEAKDDRDEGQGQDQRPQRAQTPDDMNIEEGFEAGRKLTSESTEDPPKKEEAIEDLKKNVPQEFLQNLGEKNLKFLTHRNIFSQEYFDFVSELISQRKFTPNFNYDETYQIDPVTQPQQYYDLELLKLGVLFLLTAIFRDKSRSSIISFLPFIKRQLSQNVPACLWLLDMFCSKKLHFEFFLDCPVQDMQRFAVGVITTAYKVVYEYEGKGVNNRLFDSDDVTNIPKTILSNFTNCCINLIFDAKQNNRDSTEFFRIFCDMISCGPEVAEYLIAKKVIGRLMDFFHETSSPLNDFFRDMSDALFKEPANLDLGQPQEEKRRMRTAWEEFMLKRKDRQTYENHSAQKSYFWKIIAMLIVYCRINPDAERCEWQIGDADCEILPEERSLLRTESKFIDKVIRDAQTKIGYRSVAKFYSYLCYEDSKFTTNFIKATLSGISEGEGSHIRAFKRCFIALTTLKDSFTQVRCNDMCANLVKTMYENSNYPIEMNTYISFVIKLMERVEGVRTWFVNNVEKWNWVLEWLNDHPVPPLGGNIGINKKRLQIGSSGMKNDVKEYKAKTALKVRKLKSFIENGLQAYHDDWDSDDDMTDKEIVMGTNIDLLPPGNDKWCTAKVVNILEEMLYLSYFGEDGEEQHIWISNDSENIAAHKGMQARQEEVEVEAEKMETEQDMNIENQNEQDRLTDHEDSHKGEQGTDQSSEDSMI